MLKATSATSVRIIWLSMLVGLSILLASDTSFAQMREAHNGYDKGTPAESKSGLAGLSSYAQDKIETVNLANGNFALHIPLVTIGGRGAASYTIALTYNSKVWIGHNEVELIVEDLDRRIFVRRNHNAVRYDDGTLTKPNLIPLGGGWSISKGPAIKVRMVDMDPLVAGKPEKSGYQYVMTKVWLVLPDGSEVEMRDVATNGAPALTQDDGTGYHPRIDRNRGRVWRSTDGSAITYVTDDDNGVATGLLAGWVYLADGTRLRLGNGGKCKEIIDRNGNRLDINSDDQAKTVTYVDSLGREVILREIIQSDDTVGATVTIKGYDGVSDRVISVDTGMIGATDVSGNPVNLRSDYWSLQRPFITGDYDGYNLGSHTYGAPHTDLFYDHNTGEGSDIFAHYSDITEETPVTRLNLLDGRAFQFRYNQYGELAEIVYPGGGLTQLNYEAGGSPLCEGGPLSVMLNRRVKERKVLSDAVNVDAVWTYAWDTVIEGGTSFPRATMEVRQGNGGLLLMREKHYFLALNKEYRTCSALFSDGTGSERWDNAKEYKVERETSTGVQTEKREWEQRELLSWANDPGSAVNAYRQEHGQEQPPNDVRVDSEDMVLENGKLKRTKYEYDDPNDGTNNDFNNVTSVIEYDFGSTTGDVGQKLRQIRRTYVTSLNNYCYTNLNARTGSCDGSVSTDMKEVIHLRRLLSSEEVLDANDVIEARTEYEYDNYQADQNGNYAPIVTNPGMSRYEVGRFGLYNVISEPRGNVTRVRSLISVGSYAEGYSQYDNAGNVVKVKDPNGNATTISYQDNFGNGSNPETGTFTPPAPTFTLPTTITNAANHSVKLQYSYARGIATGVKDANGVISKTDYDDFDRPTRVTAAYGLAEQTVSEMSYPTASANEARASKQLDATRWLSSRTVFDGFGRSIKSSQSEDGLHYNNFSINSGIHSDIKYDGLGRPRFSTNPYRASGEATNGWTRMAYDLAGRVFEVATFSGSPSSLPPETGTTGTGVTWTGSVTTTYDSEKTMVKDQDDKRRRSTTDGLGRLIKVDEMNDLVSVYAITNYTYDARGNLKRVNQGSQVRRFAYDGLSRLIYATNPEQAVDAALSYNGESWAMHYLYDAGSNLKEKTDTRRNSQGDLVKVSYTYDNLNRVRTRSYNDGTPTVTYDYDGQTTGKGRLVSVEAAGVSKYNFTAYDALGRLTVYNQATEGQTYSMTNSYNKAGLITSQGYPSGNKVVLTEYDSAGRVAGVQKQGGAYYAGDGSNPMLYTAHGAVSAMRLGNTLWEHTQFNSRLQPTQIGLGTASSNSSLLQLDYAYGLTASSNNGNITRQTISAPLPNSQTLTLVQDYEYDQVNRLKSAVETRGGVNQWKQGYGYDQWGNRWVKADSSTNYVPTPLLTPRSTNDISTETNRIQMSGFGYDQAGNLRSDPVAGLTRWSMMERAG
jgi:YD repeat-containing protein